MAQIFLTDELVRTATCPASKQQEIIWDCPIGGNGKVRHGAIAGLGLRVTCSGKKAFVHAFRFNGKRVRHVLGDARILSVASARMMVLKRELNINDGRNPAADYTDYRQVHTMTVRELITEYHTGKLHRLSPAHQRSFRSLVAPWLILEGAPAKGGPRRRPQQAFGTKYADCSAEQVTPRMVAAFVNAITSDYQANAALRHVKSMYNWALKMQLIDMRNPADPIDLRHTVRHRRDYTLPQIRKLVHVIFNPPQDDLPIIEEQTGLAKRDAVLVHNKAVQMNQQMVEFCAYMGILLLTMARPNEVRQAEFDHFDLEQLIWHKHNTKGLKLSRSVSEYAYRSVPIHPRVADLVIAQRQRWPDAKHVFPCHIDHSKSRNNFQKISKRFRDHPDVPDYFQLYDLKRIAISLMLTGQGVSRDAVSHYVDHKGNIETTMIYDLGLVDPLRPVTEKLGSLLGI
ncbi:MAG: integrase [Martelella sp.]|uniref:Integrase family protein n=1 Tax=Martelella lutilitoris TaxID=2583532 RepID=A0A7T7HND4_9HYPH|nr:MULTISPECIES: integrase family protein [Martelella]MAU21053.1 integrase [Martelella sp.]QQM32355.1 integrase family protein [Martelella lutilitoris]